MTQGDPLERGDDPLDCYAAEYPRRFINGRWVEVEPPNPMRINKKEVAKRRKHRKEVRKQKRRMRK